MVSEYLKSANVTILDWPGNSPDLNPIENCWDYLKNHLTTEVSTSTLTLKEGKVKLWHDLGKDYLANLTTSMPRGLPTSNQEQGGKIKY